MLSFTVSMSRFVVLRTTCLGTRGARAAHLCDPECQYHPGDYQKRSMMTNAARYAASTVASPSTAAATSAPGPSNAPAAPALLTCPCSGAVNSPPCAPLAASCAPDIPGVRTVYTGLTPAGAGSPRGCLSGGLLRSPAAALWRPAGRTASSPAESATGPPAARHAADHTQRT